MGWAGVAGTDGRIMRLELPHATRQAATASLVAGIVGSVVESERSFLQAIKQLSAYFSGETVDFDCELDLAGRSHFEIAVWNTARDIKFGEVRTYGWIAHRIGRPEAARAVGQALGRNPIPVIIPCHRVIRCDGTLGGFSSGLQWKRRLLELEGANVR